MSLPNGFDDVIHFYKLSHTTYTFRIAQGVPKGPEKTLHLYQAMYKSAPSMNSTG